MPLSINAWLAIGIDEYKLKMQDATVEFFIAENRLNRLGITQSHIDDFYHSSMRLAELAQKAGDDSSYLQGLRKVYTRMMGEFANERNPLPRREQCRKYAREALTLTCELYHGYGVDEKARQLRSDFVKRSSMY